MGEQALLAKEIMPKLKGLESSEIVRGDFERKYPDFEQFITSIDLKYLRCKSIHSETNRVLAGRYADTRKMIVEQTVRLFDVERLSVGALDDHPLLKQFVEIIPHGSGVLTLNYDCVLDQALYLSKRWSPFGGYEIEGFPGAGNLNNQMDRILLLKLHGSCNFRERIGEGDDMVIDANEDLFPGIAPEMARECTGSGEHQLHVLLLSYIKECPRGILTLWHRAMTALSQADALVLVGCSLREEDTFLRFALYHFGMKADTDTFFIEIVDDGRENCREIRKRIMNVVANPRKVHTREYEGGLASFLSEYVSVRRQ